MAAPAPAMDYNKDQPPAYPPVYPQVDGAGQYPPPQGGAAYPPPQGGAAPYPPQGAAPYPPPQAATTVVTTAVVQAPMGRYPCQTTCRFCKENVMTNVEYVAGAFCWILVVGLCLIPGMIIGFCLIPLCIDGCKDAVHHCPKCNAVLYRKSAI
eukprot:sb/3473322/